MTGANEDLFDRVADRYDEDVPFFATFGRRLVQWAGPLGGADVLDIGAGRGAITGAVAAARPPAGSITAGDTSPAMVRRLARAALPGVRVRMLDAQALDLPDASFDVVFAGFVLSVLPDPAAAVREVARVLRPGGSLVASIPGASDDGGWWAGYGSIVAEFTARLPDGVPPGLAEAPDHDGWERMLTDAGVELVDAATEEVDLPIDGPEAHWRWLMSHGNRWLHDALGEPDRAEFRARVLDSLRRDHPAEGERLIAGADFLRIAKPGSATPPDGGSGVPAG